MSSSTSLTPPLKPRTGFRLKILAVCRISTVHQDEKSLDDQEATYRQWLDRHTDLPYDMTVISSRGSGERLDRAEYLQLIDHVESGQFDLVIAEDLSRICRRIEAFVFCETCEDFQTRLIALNDHVDTAHDDWRLHSHFAVMRHEMYNRDTSERIRRSLRNRFSQGGVFQFPIYGYVKPKGTSSDADVQKDPDAERVYGRWFTMLEEGASYAEVADWLNENNIPTGPYCRQQRWDGPMVGRVTHNPILKGVRVRNRRISQRINRTGQRRSVKAPPEELLERYCPHLAFIEPERYDRLIRMLRQRNRRYRRRGQNGRDPRANVPKKHTRWPGQHIRCGICGRLYVYGGHGQKTHLMCSGARQYQCWNGITVDGPLAAKKLSEAIFDCIAEMPDFDAEFHAMVREEAARCQDQHQDRLRQIERELQHVERQLEHIVQAIGDSGGSPTLLERLKQLEGEKDQLQSERDQLSQLPVELVHIPSMDQIKQLACQSFEGLAADSPEFGRQLKRLVPRIVVHPYRPIDGGRIVLRAELTVDLSAYVPQFQCTRDGTNALRRQLVVDLFEPPQRIQYRERICCLQTEGLSQRDIAARLGITQAAVQRAAALDRLLRQRGLDDAFVRLSQPPADYVKLRRHKHKRYSFEPLEPAALP